MKHIIKYLSTPLKMGVHYGQYMVDFFALGQLLKDIAAIAKKHKYDSKELIDTAKKIEKTRYLNSDEIKENFEKALIYFVPFTECPEGILEYIIGRKLVVEQEGEGEAKKEGLRRRTSRERIFRMRARRGVRGVFESRIFRDINDVVVIDAEERGRYELLLEVTSIKKEGLMRFYNFIKAIPRVGNTVTEIRKRKTHSSRYTFRPYPLAVRLWLTDKGAVTVPEDLRDFLNASIRYHSGEEWRTSIVLSAIAVESVLADLYEEQYKEYAPNVPLGELYHKVKERIQFSSEIMNAIEMVNEARISAVHRSRFPVSDREAVNALYGASIFVMWYSTNF